VVVKWYEGPKEGSGVHGEGVGLCTKANFFCGSALPQKKLVLMYFWASKVTFFPEHSIHLPWFF